MTTFEALKQQAQLVVDDLLSVGSATWPGLGSFSVVELSNKPEERGVRFEPLDQWVKDEQALREWFQGRTLIRISGFGMFSLKQYKAYLGRNPQTGAPIEVPAKQGVLFQSDPELRERLGRERSIGLEGRGPAENESKKNQKKQ